MLRSPRWCCVRFSSQTDIRRGLCNLDQNHDPNRGRGPIMNNKKNDSCRSINRREGDRAGNVDAAAYIVLKLAM